MLDRLRKHSDTDVLDPANERLVASASACGIQLAIQCFAE